MKNNKGFSLVELIVVIAIMAILAAVAIPTFATFITKANVASDVSFINDLEYAAQLAHTATADTVSGVKVTLKTDGSIASATYDVTKHDGTAKGSIVITVNDNDTITVKDGTGSETSDLAKDAQTAAATIDWTYKFKSTKKAGDCQIDTTDAKKLSGTATTN